MGESAFIHGIVTLYEEQKTNYPWRAIDICIGMRPGWAAR
jgi:hypothetical protein